MADGYDRFDNNEGSGGGSFVMGLLTGTVLGAGLGILFAPKAGSELRGQISEQAGNLANQASEGYRRATENAGQWAEKGKETANEWAERGKDMYGKAKDAVSRGADEAQKYVRDAASSTAGTGAPASSTGSSSSYGSGSSFGSGSEGLRGAGSSSSPSTGSTGSPTSTGGTRRNS
jgi:gas vesicle protein